MLEIPRPDAEFNDYLQEVVPYFSANKIRLSITDANIAILENQLIDWDEVYPKTQDENLSTSTFIKEKNLLRKRIEKQIHLIFDDIPKSSLTVADRKTIKAPKKDLEPTPINPVKYSPVMNIDTIRTGFHIIRFSDPTNSTTSKMPYGHKIELQIFIGAANLPDSELIFSTYSTKGKSLQQVDFLLADKGKTAYYRSCYVTNIGIRASFGVIISEIII